MFGGNRRLPFCVVVEGFEEQREGGGGVWDGRERARRPAGYMVICMKMLI